MYAVTCTSDNNAVNERLECASKISYCQTQKVNNACYNGGSKELSVLFLTYLSENSL